jgi:hypothetical protein
MDARVEHNLVPAHGRNPRTHLLPGKWALMAT